MSKSYKHRTALLFFLILIFFPSSNFGEESLKQKILIRNISTVFTMDPGIGKGKLGELREVDILFDRQIISIGKDLPSTGARVIDGTGKIAMPGFVDVHNHLWQSLIRGCGANKELMGWLKECVSPMGNNVIDEAGAYAGVRLSALDLISTGVTTVLDISHSFTKEFAAGNLKALEESGLRYIYAYCFGKGESVEQNILKVKKEIIDKNPLASLQLCSHPSPKALKKLETTSKLARKLNLVLNVHLLESPAQIKDNPILLLEKTGALNSNLFAGHAIHLTEDQINLLAERKVSVAHNPLSNMRLASGVMPIQKFHTAGIKIGLGLDGGTNDTSDMFANMRAAVGLQRASHTNPAIYPNVEDVLILATMGGAEALHMEKKIGSLTPGKRADLIVIDPQAINFAPQWSTANQIVFNAQPRNVKYVFINGNPLMSEGKLNLKDTSAKKIIDQANQAVARIKKNLKLQH